MQAGGRRRTWPLARFGLAERAEGGGGGPSLSRLDAHAHAVCPGQDAKGNSVRRVPSVQVPPRTLNYASPCSVTCAAVPSLLYRHLL